VKPTEDEVLQYLRQIVTTELHLRLEFQLSDRIIADLELDSLALTTLMASLENRYRIVISDGDAETLVTIGDLVRLVVQRAEKSAS
jgi:acyl carrier protein